ncbi:MAG: TlpA disulfide reductase family protein [Gallionellaceae bacterium]
MRMVCTLLASCLLLFATAASANGFALKDSAGHIHHLADYRGKWVLVNFWATWCAPCLEEIPELADLYNAHKNKDLMVIGVAMEYPSPQIVLDFLKENPIPYPVVMGDYRMAKQIGAVAALPTSFLFDPKGKLASYQPGPVTRKSVEEYMRSKK